YYFWKRLSCVYFIFYFDVTYWSVRRLYFGYSRYRWCYHYLSSYFIITATIWCSCIQCIHRFRTYFQSSLFQYFKWVIKSAKKNRILPAISYLYEWRYDYREHVRRTPSKFI